MTLIGISASIFLFSDEIVPAEERNYVSNNYIDSVSRAGAIPILLPLNLNKEKIRQMADLVDGLVLTGGFDIDPVYYGQEVKEKCGAVYPERDEFEFGLYERMCETNKPVLAICRGLQLINVHDGGSLYQDISYAPFETIKHIQANRPEVGIHDINIEKDSYLGNILGEKYRVNSLHHQIIDKLSPKFRAIAKSNDGVVEAIEKKSENLVVGVQFHPEMLSKNDDYVQKIFDNFVKNAKTDR